MIKIFYAIGDSFVWGSELDGDHESDAKIIFTEHKRKNTYSGIITDHYNIPAYMNAGRPGVSNERTYRFLLSDISKLLLTYKPEEIFVSISLTSAMRREFCNTNGIYYPHLNAHEPPKNSSQYALWKMLVMDYNYDQAHYVFDVMLTHGMQNFLKVNKVPFLITSSMRSEVEEERYINYVEKHVYDLLYNKRYHVLPSFQTYNVIQKHPIGKHFHPLEEGHRDWAKYLISVIDDNNLFDNGDL